jgi:phage terminase large subunit-like protein
MPWQQEVADVACEVLPDGRWRYATVVVSTPRQAGKTTLLEFILALRSMIMADHRAWYTAQTGLHARDVWNEWARNLERGMPGRWRVRRSAGSEELRWKANDSFIRPFPPTADSLHSKQSDFVGLDEVWAYTVEDGSAITQGVVPTQATRHRRQLWIVSTAGTADSVWFRSWIDRGREAVNDPDASIAYFEWSAPADAPWDDPETWAAYHPAYGITQDEAAFRAAIEQFGEEEFRRGFLNQWPTAEVSWRASWPGLASTDRIPDKARVWLAADAAPNHRNASIVAAGLLVGGRIGVEVIEDRTGIDWLRSRLVELAKTHRAVVAIHRGGPVGHLADELPGLGVQVEALTGQHFTDAATRFRILVMSGGLAHADDPRLNTAVENAVLREVGDRAVWRRKDSTIPISPVVAASMAVSLAANAPRKPRVRAG